VTARLTVVPDLPAGPEPGTKSSAEPKVLSRQHLIVMELLIRDAIAYRTPPFCEDCLAAPGGECDPHRVDLTRTDDYVRLAQDLGIGLEADEAGLEGLS
jgi:hypothetical protein